MRIERVRGTRDFLATEMRKRRLLEAKMRGIADRWSYEEIRTPTFELAELFTLKSGEGILKEMYEFRDKGGRHLALRPELTAPVIRMYVNELKMEPKPTKVYYFGNCFRYEEPQKARYREFWQFGAEIIGSDRPEAQAEIIALAFYILKSLGVNTELHVGHVGMVRAVLHAANVISEDQVNTVMRLIDKGERKEVITFMHDINAGTQVIDDLMRLITLKGRTALKEACDCGIIDSGSDALKELELLLKHLDYYGVTYTLNLGIARGLDYYTGMVFEIYESDGKLGAQNQVCGGGSYRLAALFGGDDTPSTGFAFGFDRLAEIFSLETKDLGGMKVVVVPIRAINTDPRVIKAAIKLTSELREFVPTYMDVMSRSIGAQLSYANTIHASFAVLVGKNEIGEGKVTLRNLDTGEQDKMSMEECVGTIRAYGCIG